MMTEPHKSDAPVSQVSSQETRQREEEQDEYRDDEKRDLDDDDDGVDGNENLTRIKFNHKKRSKEK